ncbi:MAG: hypothetical protein V7733_20605 [Paraglaciecola polaris]|uniref:hypothetical protein n=1 Tax=Paraglaciecola polaris TaxID=222814 RepID=UPI0030012424
MSIIEQFSASNILGADASLISGTNSETVSSTTADTGSSSSLESVTGVGAYFADLLAGLQGATSNNSPSKTAVSDGAAALISSNMTSGAISGESLISGAISADESIAQIQQQLMASLNANLFGGLLGEGAEGTSALMSDLGASFSEQSISSMQSNLLSNLQTSLFSSLTNITDSSVGQSGAITNSSALLKSNSITEPASTFLQDVGQYSFGEDGLGLNEVFDTINIAQHVPIVSSLYQDMTGEHMSAAASLAGGFLYGGPTGLALSAVDLLVESYTGSTMSDAIVDFDYAGLLFADNPAAAVAQQAIQTSDEPIEQSSNAYQFVSRMF